MEQNDKIENGIVTGNYFNKYTSKNPILKHMMQQFKHDLDELFKKTHGKTVLDVGCGEGYLTFFVKKRHPKVKITALDVGNEVISIAKKTHQLPGIIYTTGDIYNLTYDDKTFDCSIANEVLEHLDYPEKGIEELKRVSKRFVIVSVPREPWFRLANVARLKYLKDFGNTPGHLQNFTKSSFKLMLEKHFSSVTIKTSSLWTFALCKK